MIESAEEWEYQEMSHLRTMLEIERKRARDLIELLHEWGIEVYYSPDGLMVTDSRLESALRLPEVA
jgi:hypothetical protein